LENTIHRAVVLTQGPLIRAEDLELEGMGRDATMAIASSGAGRPLHVVEREAILATLRMTGGNRTRTASALGLSIRALRNKIGLYVAQGIEVPPSTASRV
jgi:DNA-binding NtrC family response regulator